MTCLFISLVQSFNHAKADIILSNDLCVIQNVMNNQWTLLPFSVSEAQPNNTNKKTILSCEMLKTLKSTVEIIDASLMGAQVAMKSPMGQALLSASLIQYGLTLKNPTVLAITIVGTMGISVVFFILKKEYDECIKIDREKLKSEIINELQAKFKLQPSSNIELRIKN